MKELLSKIKSTYYRIRYCALNRKIYFGRNLKIYGRLEIKGKGSVRIGDNCSITGMQGERDETVTLYTHSKHAVIVIGTNAMLCGTKIGCMHEIEIGNDVLIEEASILDTDFHSVERDRSSVLNEKRDHCKVRIGNGVAIGAKSIVMKGVIIGENAMVGPGSIVCRSLPPGCIALGNPAKIISKLNSSS
jgi:acetyltransferase-like isoleucine patch superfamily enzyme